MVKDYHLFYVPREPSCRWLYHFQLRFILVLSFFQMQQSIIAYSWMFLNIYQWSIVLTLALLKRHQSNTDLYKSFRRYTLEKVTENTLLKRLLCSESYHQIRLPVNIHLVSMATAYHIPPT